MNKAEVLEIKKQYSIKNCAVPRIAGCYVNGEKEIISKFNESFLSKPEEAIFKYLEIFKKGLSGSIGKNITTFNVQEGDITKVLKSLVDAELSKCDSVLNALYEKIIEGISDKPENYLILLMFNAYDVPNRNADKLKDGESDEVYSYITCYLCPVKTEKPGLAYDDEQGSFVKKELAHCLELPEFSFTYPSFEERSSDYGKITVYSKKADDAWNCIITELLGCEDAVSAEAQKNLFTEIIEQAVSESEVENNVEVIKKVSESIAERIEDAAPGEEPVLKAEDIKTIFKQNNINTSSVDDMAGDTSFNANVVNTPDVDIKMEGISVKVKSDVKDRLEKRLIDGEEYILIKVGSEPLVINGITIE